MMPSKNSVAGRLRTCRLEAGLTQRELAASSGVARAYISRIEAGLRDPSLETLIKLAGAMEITGLDLLFKHADKHACALCRRVS